MSDKHKERSSGLLDSLEADRPGDDGAPASRTPAAARPARNHEETVERRLLAIAWFTGIVAAAVVANFIATVAIAAGAAASLY